MQVIFRITIMISESYPIRYMKQSYIYLSYFLRPVLLPETTWFYFIHSFIYVHILLYKMLHLSFKTFK